MPDFLYNFSDIIGSSTGNIISALLILFFGWLIASMVQKVVYKSLSKVFGSIRDQNPNLLTKKN